MMLQVGQRVGVCAFNVIGHGKLFASCLQKRQRTACCGRVLCWGGHGQIVTACE